MARTFNGSTDVITVAEGAANVQMDAFTWAFIGKRAVNAVWHPVISSKTGGGTHWWALIADSSDELRIYSDDTDVTGEANVWLASHNWVCIIVTKVAGTAAPIVYRYVYDTNTWTTVNYVATNGTGTSAPAGTDMNIGAIEGDFLNGQLAALGLWTRVLTAGERESLPFSLMSWLSAAPISFWVFDQAATSMALNDLTGGGANQTAITGTSVSTLSVPVLSYGFSDRVSTVAAAAGASVKAGAGIIGP